MFTKISKQNHILISSSFSYSIDIKVREKNRKQQSRLHVKSKNFYTVIPGFATFDRVPLSHFLRLSVNAEEDVAMHYIQSLCPADRSLSPHQAQVSCPPCFLLTPPPPKAPLREYKRVQNLTCVTLTSIKSFIALNEPRSAVLCLQKLGLS